MQDPEVLRKLPLTSLIVPTFQRPQRVRGLLQSLSALNYPKSQLEILIIDDGSSPSVSQSLGAVPTDLPLRIIRQDNQGPGCARNTGLRFAEGSFVAFTDDDCEPHPDWLLLLAQAHLQHPDACLGGTVINKLAFNPYAEASQQLVHHLYEWYNRPPTQSRFFTSNNMAFPRQALLDAGAFDPSFRRAAAEDRELCRRWTRQGRPMVWVQDAVVLHSHAMQLGEYVRQHLHYGRGALHYRRVLQQDQDHEGILPSAFYWQMLARPFRTRPGWQAPAISALLLLSQVANVAGYFQELLSGRPAPSA